MHIQKGSAKNPKTGKPFDSWDCSQCGEKCSDNRACWKHFRTQHLGLYIHYCPVPGCGKGNDQKDTIVSHIKKEHKDQKELIALCNQQAFLKCKNCGKVFSSVKGKNQHEDTCGLPKTKKNCTFENVSKHINLRTGWTSMWLLPMRARDINASAQYVVLLCHPSNPLTAT